MENLEKAKKVVNGMTLREKIGQMLMPAMQTFDDGSGEERTINVLNKEYRDTITKYNLGGIILFRNNFCDVEQTIRLIDDMQQASKYPMFIAIDQEGGRVCHVGMGTYFTGNMAIRATADKKNARLSAEAIGEELDALGIKVDFAPVVDVNVNKANPVIGFRSFSDDPNEVSEYSCEFIEGLHKSGIVTSLKHFPGHGDTNVDSHTGLPCINKTLEEIEKVELIPFKAGIAAGADSIMTAHIQYPKIETTKYVAKDGREITLPATLSKTIVTDILRKKLGFEGVVFTDALNMAAIDKMFIKKDAARFAINADVDILLMPVILTSQKGIDELGEYIEGIVDMIETGEIDEATITRSAERIIALKLKYKVMDEEGRNILYKRDDSTDVDIEKAISYAKSVVSSPAHRELEWKLAKQSVTLYKNDNDTLPLKKKTALLLTFKSELAGWEKYFDELREKYPLPEGCAAICYQDKTFEELKEELSAYDSYIVLNRMIDIKRMDVNDELGWWPRFIDDVIRYGKEEGKKVVLFSAGLPYDATRYSDADAIILNYNTKQDSMNMKAGVYKLFFENEYTGVLPVKL